MSGGEGKKKDKLKGHNAGGLLQQKKDPVAARLWSVQESRRNQHITVQSDLIGLKAGHMAASMEES